MDLVSEIFFFSKFLFIQKKLYTFAHLFLKIKIHQGVCNQKLELLN